jgi:putative ABC transport system substrate-binding protein
MYVEDQCAAYVRYCFKDPMDAAIFRSRFERANPADLPVQVPTRYQTVLNLKTAKALGVTVTDKLLVAADEVIE